THYIENRRAWATRPGIQLELWAERAGIQLELPTHYCVERAESSSIEANETAEVANFSAAVSAIERSYDFLVIDTPGNDTFLMRPPGSTSRTPVTPSNGSFLVLDVLAALDPVKFAVTGESHHATLVREARRQGRMTDGRPTDWVVVRNRLSPLRSRN